MNPLTVRARNYRTFAELDLDLPGGCTAVTGENGVGKSSIINLVDICLFADRGELAQLLSLGEDELTLELKFEHAGEWYRVRRMYSGHGRGKTTLDLEQWIGQPVHSGDDEGPRWEPLTRESAVETQKLIERTIGLSRETFRASSFLAQGDGAAFTDAQPRDRKAILAEILGLSVYEQLLERAKNELRTAEGETLFARGRISTLDELADDTTTEQSLAATREALVASLERLAVAQHRFEEAQRRQSENAAAVERVRAADVAYRAAVAVRERARGDHADALQAALDSEKGQAELHDTARYAGEIPPVEQSLEQARQLQARLRERDQLLAEAARVDAERDRVAGDVDLLYRQATDFTVKADHLDAHIHEAGDCDRCGQKLGAEAAARAAASFRADAADCTTRAEERQAALTALIVQVGRRREQAALLFVDETADDVDALIALLTGKLATARSAAEQLGRLSERIRQLDELAARTPELEAVSVAADEACQHAAAAANAARAAVAPDTDELARELGEARIAVSAAADLLQSDRAAIVRLEATLERVQAARAERDKLAATVAETLRTIDVLKLAERAFGRDGIPALIVENAAIPQLEMEANRILGELGGATCDCRIELRTQREKKTGGLSETLDIVIVTPAGDRGYETFSGGERTRLNLALRIALARLLAHRRGAQSRLLAIDEPDGLDQQGMDALAEILRGLAGDFEKVLVVSHQPQLATSFDQTLRVVKDGERSRIAGGDGGAGLLAVVA